ncbi:adenylate/guanylate cyclase domain-containing protein [Gammaproteobacteria bacterium]|nr:adenylate/guanylate cyclase domain-containing protein [Gammaproteobacteria bacterium]
MSEQTAIRKLTAILYADVVGYSRLTGGDELGTHRKVMDAMDFATESINSAGGTVLRYAGDAILAEFSSVVAAVDAGVTIQTELDGRNESVPDDSKVQIRIGVNLGEVLQDRGEIYGDGVNLAARLESAAQPGGICVSGSVHDQVRGKVDLVFTDGGLVELKNIDRPTQIYRWHPAQKSDGPVTSTTIPMPEPTSGSAAKQSAIAVLPFDNMSGDSEQEYFSDGITEDIITELSRFRELQVMARNSSFYYKGQAIKVQDVGRELGVSYVVEGSVRKAGNRVRVTVQMVEVESGTHVWAERYDRELEDIFAVQDEITQSIVSVLPNRLRSAMTEQVQHKSTESFSAYEYFLQGRWVYINTGGTDPAAITMLDKAIDIDPTYAQAHAVLANLYAYSRFSLGVWYGDPEIKARSYIDNALKFGKSDSTIHTMVGESYYWLGDFDQAKFHIERALQLNPHDVSTMLVYGATLSGEGNSKEGLRWIDKALEIDPHVSDFAWESKSECLYMLCEYEACLEVMMSWRDPPPHTYSHMAACYAQLGRMDEAYQAAARFRSTCSEDVNFLRYAANHANICKRQVDKDNWLNGYRKAGLLD